MGPDWNANDSARRWPGGERMSPLAVADNRPLAFYIPNLTMGGAEQVTVNIVNGLSRRGHDVELVVSHPGGELRSEVADSVRVVELADSRTPVVGIGAHLTRLAAYLEDAGPAAFFPQKTDASVLGLAAVRLADVDTVVVPTEHLAFAARPTRSPKAVAVRRLAVWLYPAAHRVIAVSEGVADSLVEWIGLRRERVSVLNNPVEIDAIRERGRKAVDYEWLDTDDVEVVLFVGRHHTQKDLETWLRSFARVSEARPETRAIVAGTGERSDHLRELAERLDIADVVSFPGFVDNPFGYMSRASVFLLSSRYEGLPTVLVEAMACGCPVVATDCPSGPREILADGQYGRLVPVGDVDAIAGAVVATVDDPPDPSVLRRRADDFGPDAVLDEYEQFIREEIG